MSGEFHSHSQGYRFGSHCLGGCLHCFTPSNFSVSLPFLTFTHTALHTRISHKKDKLQSWQRGLIFATPITAVWKGPEGSILLCDGTLTFLDIPVLEILICCSCETTFATALFFFIAWDSGHKGPRCHPCAMAEGARAFPFGAHAAAVWHPVWAGQTLTAVCWGRTPLLWWWARPYV